MEKLHLMFDSTSLFLVHFQLPNTIKIKCISMCMPHQGVCLIRLTVKHSNLRLRLYFEYLLYGLLCIPYLHWIYASIQLYWFHSNTLLVFVTGSVKTGLYSNQKVLILTFHNFNMINLSNWNFHQSVHEFKSYNDTKFQVNTFLRQQVMDYQLDRT